MKVSLFLALLTPLNTVAFAPSTPIVVKNGLRTKVPVTTQPRASSQEVTETIKDLASSVDVDKLKNKLSELTSDIDVGKLKDNVKMAVSNVMNDGQWGERGEIYTATQFALILFVLLGGIPVLGDLLMLLLGPCLTVAGAAVAFLGFSDLGDAVTPFPVPPSGATLKTEGIYGQLRHPMYAGLVGIMAGLSILTGSANRLLLTAVLLYVLEVKTSFEEEELLKKFPAYSAYKDQVPGKFIPAALLEQLPWIKDE